jgi:putative hemolysin
VSEFLRVVAVLLLILGNAVFVAAEYALVSVRRTRLDELSEKGSPGARTALKLLDEPTRFIGVIQLAITIFGILTGAIGEPLISHFFHPIMPKGVAFALSFLILTYFSVTLGELIPKAAALQVSEPLAVIIARPLDLLATVMWPLVWVLQRTAEGGMRVLGVKIAPAGTLAHNEEDIRRILAGAEEAGVIAEQEEEMLYKIFDFAEKEATNVMVPRPEVVALSADMSPEDALAAVIDSPYTRYPVYRGSLDTVIGILHVRDLFSAVHENLPVRLEELLRPVHIVPETKDLAALLGEFRKANQHMAVVVDEYGQTQGIVTLEDLLEEIVGEIEDEYDLPDESVERIDETTIRIDGTFPIDDFNEEFGQALDQEDFHTMAGFVFGLLGRAPEVGDRIDVPGLAFEVVDVAGTRIERLQVEFVAVPEPAPSAGDVER